MEIDAKLRSQDQNRTFRTRLVIAWLLSNAGLAIVISSINGLDQTKALVEQCLPSGDEELASMNRTCITQALSLDSREVQSKQQEYFKYLLWATFGLSAVRFIGVS
jgi:chitin synthase